MYLFANLHDTREHRLDSFIPRCCVCMEIKAPEKNLRINNKLLLLFRARVIRADDSTEKIV